MNSRIAALPLMFTLACTAASEGAEGAAPEALTYYRDAKVIIDARCATCHREGNIGPFALDSYEQVSTFAAAMRASIESGTMPPWQPADDCADYEGNIDLRPDERETLLAWIDAGAVEGDPGDAPEGTGDSGEGFEPSLSLILPEPYTPAREPDDYRCQLIPWPEQETRYVTGLRVTPEQGEIVHHVIVFAVEPDQVEQYQAYDEAEEGPGYTCYGGPRAGEGGLLEGVDPAALLAALAELGLSLEDLQSGNLSDEQLAALLAELGINPGGASWIGGWVPGAPTGVFPAGTGIAVAPGSMLVAQIHYNTSTAEPVADQSTIELQLADTVEREATMLTIADIGWISDGLFGEPMTIPAGEAEVSHSTSAAFDSIFAIRARAKLGLADDAPLVIHRANHHMHQLGTSQRSEIHHAEGSTRCVLDIPDWDFAWQGSYTLADPITLSPGDELRMGCTWDNSAANQPVVDGELREPADVAWGEGTDDEMCLGVYYVTQE